MGGGEQIVGRVLGEDAELGLGLGWVGHAQQEVAEFAAEFVVGRVQREGAAEFGDEWIAGGEQLASHFGGARFTAAGGGQEGGGGLLVTALRFPYPPQIHQHTAPIR